MPSDEESRIAEAVRLYREGQTAREVAAALGTNDKKVRGWLRGAGATRKRGVRPAIDPVQVRQARCKRGESWAQVARELGISETGAKKAYRRGYRDTGRIDRATHLSGAQKGELGHLWDSVPPPENGTGHAIDTIEGRKVLGLLRHYRRAGVTGAELAGVLGVSRTRLYKITQD